MAFPDAAAASAGARYLVTGASGFVGQRLVARLVAAGHSVRAAVRRTPDAGLFPPGVEPVVVGDIGPDTDWTAALAGMDGVAHLAARVHMMHDPASDPLAAYRQVNTQGTACLAAAAVRAGVRRFVFVSSVKAVYDEGDVCLRAQDPPVAGTSPYGRSKWEAEQGLLAMPDLDVAVIRPPLVYGPGVAGNFRSLLRLVALGLPLPLASLDNRRSMVFVDNLADAIARMLEQPAPLRGAYFVHDGAPLSTPDIVRRLAAGMGRPARLLPFPPGLMRAAALLAGRLPVYDRLAGSLTVDDTPLRAALGWTPPVDAQTALARTAAAFAAAGGRAGGSGYTSGP